MNVCEGNDKRRILDSGKLQIVLNYIESNSNSKAVVEDLTSSLKYYTIIQNDMEV